MFTFYNIFTCICSFLLQLLVFVSKNRCPDIQTDFYVIFDNGEMGKVINENMCFLNEINGLISIPTGYRVTEEADGSGRVHILVQDH